MQVLLQARQLRSFKIIWPKMWTPSVRLLKLLIFYFGQMVITSIYMTQKFQSQIQKDFTGKKELLNFIHAKTGQVWDLVIHLNIQY